MPQPLDAALAAASPLYRRVLFVLATPGAAGESVAAGLGALRDAVSPAAPRLLFDQGLGRVLANFYVSSREGAREGLSALADEQQVLAAVRELADALLGAPRDGLLVDHSAGDARYAEFVAAVYPDATFVHVLRHPMDCVSGAGPGDVPTRAQAWVDGNAAVRRISARADVDVVRIDFDVLAADPHAALRPTLTALRRANEIDVVADAVSAALSAQPAPTRSDSQVVDRLCGALWRDFGGSD